MEEKLPVLETALNQQGGLTRRGQCCTSAVLTQWEASVAQSKTACNSNSQTEIFDAAPLEKDNKAEKRLMELEVINNEDKLDDDERVVEEDEEDGEEDGENEGLHN
ncbi:uncharacterized protein MELLADRAFT_103007 [Melampsora larici-populina 98AG31]|uniref:Uncharacterized protein n=1 Tax=Melampsora larici-populina (strain 98AG31 / pathotype 3-4-7) TaxID=747676 RepID=F4RA90_MELLP|nr:uncharacterized protein MELLADRAFT_103007 [Melampsora larici-populina 98AG31]EGG10821.1 hypothetical protein MELLADRAFT_103007 [Melampsora larici-populina 98AG31]